MPIWIVSASWMEDEAEVSEQWEVNAPTAYDAVREAEGHIRFLPHRIDARLSKLPAGSNDGEAELTPGAARHLPLR